MNFKEEIAKQLQNFNAEQICQFDHTEHSVYFGIFGAWGRGKTYFSELVAQKLKGENYRVIQYNASTEKSVRNRASAGENTMGN